MSLQPNNSSPSVTLSAMEAVLKTDAKNASITAICTNGVVRVGDVEVDFTAVEYRLLCTFLERKGRVQSREQLIDLVWGMGTAITHRTVDVHIKRLRTKLGPVAANYVDTVWGVGYRFLVPETNPRPAQ